MNICKFDYYLPKEYIAQNPANPRDSAKLLILDRKSGTISYSTFYKLLNYLSEEDVLVFNKSKVFPARLYGTKKTGGKVEILILRFLDDFTCEVITKPGLYVKERILFHGFEGITSKREGYITYIKFNIPHIKLQRKIIIEGHTPTPPYIKSSLSEKDLREKYQTVYAKVVGSSAAPTAGLHFTKELLKRINKSGIQTEFVTLHVGLGTFASVKEKDIKKHKIHGEYFSIDENTVKRLNQAKKDGKRIVAVGTTTTRVLETLAQNNSLLKKQNGKNHFTNLYIYPPFKFKFVDHLITNFHLPKSTLLMLVSAFVTKPNTKDVFNNFKDSILGRAYNEAVLHNYRFFSFGDAMFIK